MKGIQLVIAGVFVGAVCMEILNRRARRKTSILGSALRDVAKTVKRTVKRF
ncbi:MAG: hypothetical protein HQK83_04415 [Fibrobacteria bacterium]|nr:hypothetical protein [Fibrobacteria bacterium]